jgi:hypothetical protein
LPRYDRAPLRASAVAVLWQTVSSMLVRSRGTKTPLRFGTLALCAVAWTPSRAVAEPLPESPEWGVPVAHSLGVFTGTRLAEAILYPDPFAETDLGVLGRNYREAFTRPPLFDPDEAVFEWDGDPWTINVIGHGLLGSELYYRPRRCGFSVLAALAFAAGASVVWEYAFEANGVRPSALDLVYTPAVGLVLGEARFWAFGAAGSLRDPTWRAIVRAVVDPFGELERELGAVC